MKKNVLVISIIVIIIVAITVGIVIHNKNLNKQYEIEEISEYKYYLLSTENGVGVIDEKGNILVQPAYKNIKIPNPQKAVFICEEDNSTKILNEKGEQIFTQYTGVDAILLKGIVSATPYEKSVLKYEQDGKYGLLNFEGKQVTKPKYDEIEGLTNKEGELAVRKDGKYGVINSKGAELIKPQYDTVSGDGFYTNENKYKNSGYIVSNRTQDGYRYGYINSKLKKVMDLKYSEIYRVIENTNSENAYIIASIEGKYGVLKNEEILLDYIYQDIEYGKENNVFIVKKNTKYGAFNIEGKEIVQVNYEQVEEAGIYIKAIANDETQYYDLQGNKLENYKYDIVNKTANENYYITIDKEGKYGVINNEQKELVKQEYGYIEYLFDNYFIASKQDGNLGIIDDKNNTKIDFKYDVIQKIGDSKIVEAKIIAQNKSEIYSENLKLIVSMKNAAIKEYDDYVKIFNDEQTKYFDKQGEEKENTQIFINNELYAVQKNNKWGFANKNKEVIVEYKYDKVTEFNQAGYAGICIDNKWGVINTKGEVIVSPKYTIEEQEPEFIGEYYKVYYGYGQSYFTNKI